MQSLPASRRKPSELSIADEQGPAGPGYPQILGSPGVLAPPVLRTCRGEQGLEREHEDGQTQHPKTNATQNHRCKGNNVFGGTGGATAPQQHQGVQRGIRQATRGCQLDVTSSLPPPRLHVTSLFRGTKESNTFYFLLKDRISVREMLLETISPGEEHPGTHRAAQHPHCRQGPPVPTVPGPGADQSAGYLPPGWVQDTGPF